MTRHDTAAIILLSTMANFLKMSRFLICSLRLVGGPHVQIPSSDFRTDPIEGELIAILLLLLPVERLSERIWVSLSDELKAICVVLTDIRARLWSFCDLDEPVRCPCSCHFLISEEIFLP